MFNDIGDRQMAYGFGIGVLFGNYPISQEAVIVEWERYYVWGSYDFTGAVRRDFMPFFG